MGHDVGLEASRPAPGSARRRRGTGLAVVAVALAIVVAAVLHVALPAKYRVNPPWVAPVVLLALLAALIIGDPGRIDRQKTWLRIVTGAMIACITVANLFAAVRLVRDILSLAFWTATAFSPTDISGDQAVGQADDDGSGGVPGHRRARDRPRNQHLAVEPGTQPAA
jgi:hypothetical protein